MNLDVGRRRARGRLALTPFGAGVLSLFFPGLLIAAATHQVALMAVAIGAGALLTLDAIAGRYLLDRVAIDVLVPHATTVGKPFPVSVRLRSDHQIELGLEVSKVSARVPALAPGRGELTLSVNHRGVFDRIIMRLHTAAPLGLVMVFRPSPVVLDRSLHVGPRPAGTTIDVAARGADLQVPGLDEPVGIRGYVAGDSLRDVHWATVARTGSLQVRDRRADAEPTEVTAIVVLGDGDGGDERDDDADERDDGEVPPAANRARAALDSLLSTGARIRLVTAEEVAMTPGRLGGQTAVAAGPPTGPELRWVTGPIASRDDITVRLARAAIGPAPGVAPAGAGHTLRIDTGGERWSSES